MPNPDGGAVQFFREVDPNSLPEGFVLSGEIPEAVRNGGRGNRLARENSVPPVQAMPRWRIPGRDDLAVTARTKSEARAWFKTQLGELPVGFELERY
jgi:hypothetical protein